jgi:glycosyltransferase involved in cell wall biosynthesis
VRTIGYFPYSSTPCSAEAGWLREHLRVSVRVAQLEAALNCPGAPPLPPLDSLSGTIGPFLGLPAVVTEGPGGFLWAALLRARGFSGTVTVLPYLNPRRWYDVAAICLYRRFAAPGDRVFLGSSPSAAVYRCLGVDASVGEPYGIDDQVFGLRPGAAARVRDQLRIPPGRMLLFTGRAQPDKDLYRLLSVGLKARLLFPDLSIVIASHVSDPEYLATARQMLGADAGVHFVADPGRELLADLYNAADLFVTASTSHFETFGRAPAEALACGLPAVAPRYDGFAEVLAQPGGTLVDVHVDEATGAPYLPGELLLRAVYDVLSSPRPPRHDVAAAARRRFGRSGTIGLLGYLAGETVRDLPAGTGAVSLARARVELPREWRRPLAQILKGEPMDALRWFWHDCDQVGLSSFDGQFAVRVRQSLCVPRPRVETELVPCR